MYLAKTNWRNFVTFRPFREMVNFSEMPYFANWWYGRNSYKNGERKKNSSFHHFLGFLDQMFKSFKSKSTYWSENMDTLTGGGIFSLLFEDWLSTVCIVSSIVVHFNYTTSHNLPIKGRNQIIGGRLYLPMGTLTGMLDGGSLIFCCCLFHIYEHYI